MKKEEIVDLFKSQSELIGIQQKQISNLNFRLNLTFIWAVFILLKVIGIL